MEIYFGELNQNLYFFFVSVLKSTLLVEVFTLTPVLQVRKLSSVFLWTILFSFFIL